MTVRSTERVVTFRHSFSLSGADRRLPPGEYRILREEESIEGLSFMAYRTTSMVMEVPLDTAGVSRVALDGSSSMEMIPVNAAELDAALDSDSQDGLTAH
jgi:hypothetical protein